MANLLLRNYCQRAQSRHILRASLAPPSSKVSQVEMRQVIARVTCLAFL